MYLAFLVATPIQRMDMSLPVQRYLEHVGMMALLVNMLMTKWEKRDVTIPVLNCGIFTLPETPGE